MRVNNKEYFDIANILKEKYYEIFTEAQFIFKDMIVESLNMIKNYCDGEYISRNNMSFDTYYSRFGSKNNDEQKAHTKDDESVERITKLKESIKTLLIAKRSSLCTNSSYFNPNEITHTDESETSEFITRINNEIEKTPLHELIIRLLLNDYGRIDIRDTNTVFRLSIIKIILGNELYFKYIETLNSRIDSIMKQRDGLDWYKNPDDKTGSKYMDIMVQFAHLGARYVLKQDIISSHVNYDIEVESLLNSIGDDTIVSNLQNIDEITPGMYSEFKDVTDNKTYRESVVYNDNHYSNDWNHNNDTSIQILESLFERDEVKSTVFVKIGIETFFESIFDCTDIIEVLNKNMIDGEYVLTNENYQSTFKHIFVDHLTIFKNSLITMVLLHLKKEERKFIDFTRYISKVSLDVTKTNSMTLLENKLKMMIAKNKKILSTPELKPSKIFTNLLNVVDRETYSLIFSTLNNDDMQNTYSRMDQLSNLMYYTQKDGFANQEDFLIIFMSHLFVQIYKHYFRTSSIYLRSDKAKLDSMIQIVYEDTNKIENYVDRDFYQDILKQVTCDSESNPICVYNKRFMNTKMFSIMMETRNLDLIRLTNSFSIVNIYFNTLNLLKRFQGDMLKNDTIVSISSLVEIKKIISDVIVLYFCDLRYTYGATKVNYLDSGYRIPKLKLSDYSKKYSRNMEENVIQKIKYCLEKKLRVDEHRLRYFYENPYFEQLLEALDIRGWSNAVISHVVENSNGFYHGSIASSSNPVEVMDIINYILSKFLLQDVVLTKSPLDDKMFNDEQ